MRTEHVGSVATSVAMASHVAIFAASGSAEDRSHALDGALEAIAAVERSCSRFDSSSDLSRLNAQPSDPMRVDPVCFEVIAAAVEAHRRTHGRFDPRIIEDLEALGYDRSFTTVAEGSAFARRALPRSPWDPELEVFAWTVDLRGERIDLGGIAKGSAADRAIATMAAMGVRGLVDIGGDGSVSGPDEAGAAWSVGVEDPLGGDGPVAVLDLVGGGYATSSTRIRRWRSGGVEVHHLLDPSTGLPGGEGMASATVLCPSATIAEVEAKAAFLAGAHGVAEHCEERSLACLWVTADGEIGRSRAIEPAISWMRP